MVIIGVTGPSGAGKGSVSEYLATRHKFKVIDADVVYHSIISSPSDCVNELVSNFGERILNENGGIDRKSLSPLVFGEENKEKLLLLNTITHKYVKNEINKLIKTYFAENAAVCVIDAPLLIEAGIDEMCDYVIAVIAPKEIRAKRIAMRDGIDEEAALLRINSQNPDSFYEEKCDFILQNIFLGELGRLVDSYLKCEGLIQ